MRRGKLGLLLGHLPFQQPPTLINHQVWICARTGCFNQCIFALFHAGRPITSYSENELIGRSSVAQQFVCLFLGVGRESVLVLVSSGRSCIIGPAVASSSSPRPFVLHQAPKEKHMEWLMVGRSLPAQRRFFRALLPCHSPGPVKTLSHQLVRQPI